MRRVLIATAVLAGAFLVVPFGLGRAPRYSPEGSWNQGKESVLYIRNNNRLYWTMALDKGASITIEAEYNITGDSVLYGIITRMDLPPELKDLAEKLPAEDDTFSFRLRADEDSLVVKDLRGKGTDQLRRYQGRYKRSAPETTRDKYGEAKDKGKDTRDKDKE